MTPIVDIWHTIKIFYKTNDGEKLLCHWIRPPLSIYPDGLSWFESRSGSRRHKYYTPDTSYLGAIPQTFLPSIGLAVEDFRSVNLHVESGDP